MNPASSDASVAHDCAHAARLVEHLQVDDVDGAIEAGLMLFVPCPACDTVPTTRLLQAQRKLREAWAARDRYRARDARLARRAAEREARRAVPPEQRKSSLPPAAAAILARAKAKAAERGKP